MLLQHHQKYIHNFQSLYSPYIKFYMEKLQTSNSAQFKFEKLFGYKSSNDKIQQEDIISSLKFDQSGKLLALGDRAGRIIIFQAPQIKKKGQSYEYYAQFQSHIRQFDHLRSQEVDETISDISWLKPQGKYRKVLTSNCKKIKLWKIFEKSQKKLAKSAGKQLSMPKIQTVQSSLVANVQKIFPSHHCSFINSVSHSFNEQYLLSSDQVQAFLWSLEKPDQPYMVVDLKRNDKIEEVKELLTCSKMHPTSDSIFAFGTSKGSLKLGDLRTSALCDSALSFKYDIEHKNFFTQMISSYSSVDFMANARQLVTRDYLTIKIWDLATNKKPLATITIQDSLKSKLCQMFQNDAIFDKFSVSTASDSKTILTGNYNNSFHLIDSHDLTNMQYELTYKKNTVCKQVLPNKMVPLPKMDYQRKTLAGDFHPKKNTVAVASLNCFFIYSI